MFIAERRKGKFNSFTVANWLLHLMYPGTRFQGMYPGTRFRSMYPRNAVPRPVSRNAVPRHVPPERCSEARIPERGSGSQPECPPGTAFRDTLPTLIIPERRSGIRTFEQIFGLVHFVSHFCHDKKSSRSPRISEGRLRGKKQRVKHGISKGKHRR